MSAVNTGYIDALIDQIESVGSCAKLQELAAKILGELSDQLTDMQDKLAEFLPLVDLLDAPTSPDDVVEWIQSLIDKVIRPMTIPASTYQLQITAQLAAIARLTSVINDKAAEFTDCSVTP